MIEFSHVSKLFGAQKAVNDLNLNFQEGSFSVLIGTSGSGKSTTLKMINRLVEHDSGEIRFAGEEIRSLPVLELRRRMCNFAFFSGLIGAQFWAERAQPKSPELDAKLLVSC